MKWDLLNVLSRIKRVVLFFVCLGFFHYPSTLLNDFALLESIPARHKCAQREINEKTVFPSLHNKEDENKTGQIFSCMWYLFQQPISVI